MYYMFRVLLQVCQTYFFWKKKTFIGNCLFAHFVYIFEPVFV